MKSQTPRSQQTEVPEVFWHSAIRYVLSSARSRGHLLVVWFIFTCHLHVLPHRLNSAGPLSSLPSAPPFSSLSSYHPPRYREPCSSFSPRLTKDPPQIKPVCSVLPYVSCRVLFPGQEPEVLIMNWVRFITCNYLCVCGTTYVLWERCVHSGILYFLSVFPFWPLLWGHLTHLGPLSIFSVFPCFSLMIKYRELNKLHLIMFFRPYIVNLFVCLSLCGAGLSSIIYFICNPTSGHEAHPFHLGYLVTTGVVKTAMWLREGGYSDNGQDTNCQHLTQVMIHIV